MTWHFNSDMPIYTQLVSQIKFAIVSGGFRPGERMSTVRDMAVEAGVNPNTMQRAFQELERAGLVYSQRSSGRFVTEDVSVIEREKSAMAHEHISSFITAMEKLGYSREEIVKLLAEQKEEKNGDI